MASLSNPSPSQLIFDPNLIHPDPAGGAGLSAPDDLNAQQEARRKLADKMNESKPQCKAACNFAKTTAQALAAGACVAATMEATPATQTLMGQFCYDHTGRVIDYFNENY